MQPSQTRHRKPFIDQECSSVHVVVLKDHMVQDPIAKVKFPKYAAGATLEVDGKTHYFIDEVTLHEFQQQQASKE